METYVIADGPVGSVSSKWAKGTGGPAGDECYNLIAAPLAFGGNNTTGPIEVATARNSHPGPAGRQDFESETFIVELAKTVVSGVPARNPLHETLIVFDETQITSAENRCQPKNGDPSHPLAASARPPAIAIQNATRGKSQNGLGTPLATETDRGDADQVLMTGTAVRRLTPLECERLQAFPDGWTDITFRGKPAADGNRYKALGNAMCVAEIRWVLQRIELFSAAFPPPP